MDFYFTRSVALKFGVFSPVSSLMLSVDQGTMSRPEKSGYRVRLSRRMSYRVEFSSNVTTGFSQDLSSTLRVVEVQTFVPTSRPPFLLL